MRRRKCAGWLLTTLILTWPASGCGGSQGGTTAALVSTNEGLALEEVGRTYQAFLKKSKRSPKGLKDVLPFEQGYPSGIGALQRGDVVVFWGADLDKTSQGASSVLAYEKTTPENGGLALMQDLSLKRLTADEFKAAPKSPGTDPAKK